MKDNLTIKDKIKNYVLLKIVGISIHDFIKMKSFYKRHDKPSKFDKTNTIGKVDIIKAMIEKLPLCEDFKVSVGVHALQRAQERLYYKFKEVNMPDHKFSDWLDQYAIEALVYGTFYGRTTEDRFIVIYGDEKFVFSTTQKGLEKGSFLLVTITPLSNKLKMDVCMRAINEKKEKIRVKK